MAKFKSFPHYEINVKDESGTNPLAVENLSVHRPLYHGLSEKGPVGKPFYGSYDELVALFGEGTFDEYSKYFKHSTVFAKENLKYQKIFWTRVAPDTAKEASFVVEADIEDDGSGPITVTWGLRELEATEKINDIAIDTSTTNHTVIPVWAGKMTSPGEYGNNVGISIYSDSDDDDDSQDLGARIYSIELWTIPYGSDTPVNIRDMFLNKVLKVSFKENTVDPATGKRMFISEILDGDFSDNVLPFNSHLYSDNVKTIGDMMIAADDAGNITDPWLIDIFGRSDGTNIITTDFDGNTLTHITINSDFVDDIKHYAIGGDDGLSNDFAANNLIFENLVQTWFTVTSGIPYFPDILDNARYPVTHIYDTGFTTDTKMKLIDFAAVRDDIKISISTQSVYKSADGTIDDANDSAGDYSAGSILVTQARLHPESFLFGTQACRFTVYTQCGKITTNPKYTYIVPATIDAMVKKAFWHGATYIKGEPKGLPFSEVTILKDVNWFPVSDTVKQLDWDAGLNYMQYYDMTSYHYPSVKSVYANDTSLLSDDIFLDYIVYLKHLARIEWAKYAGVSYSLSRLIGNIERTLTASIYKTLGTYIRTEVTAYQTTEDKLLGYQLTVQIAVYDTPSNRVWKVIIPVRREEA